MSLLADLLSKVTHPESKRKIPPHLKDIIIRDSIQKKKIILISASFVAVIISGIVIVQLISSLTESSKKKVAVKTEEARVKTEEERVVKLVPSKEDFVGTQKVPVAEKIQPLKKTEEVKALKKDTVPERLQKPPAPVKKEEPKPEAPKKKTIDTALRDAHLYSARNYELKKDYSKALSEYRKVLEIDKDNFTVMNNMAYILLEMGLVNEAIKYSQMAVDKKKDYVPALMNLGIAYARIEDTTFGEESHRQAETYLKRALTIEPDNKTVILNLAIFYERKGDYPKALEYFLKLTGLADVTGSLGLARIHERQGRVEEALEIYKNIYPNLKDTETRKMVAERINLITEGLKAKGKK